MYSKEQLDKRVRFIMNEITRTAQEGTDLVPTSTGKIYILSLAQELFRLSEGVNEVVFTRAGRPSIYVNFFIDEKAKNSYLSENGTHFATTGLDKIHPAFLTNGKLNHGFRLGKFSWVNHKNKNYPVSLYNMDPANNLSLNSSIDLAIAENSSTINPTAPAVHCETLSEWSYIANLSLKEGFQARGNDNFTTSSEKSSESGSPGGYRTPEYSYQILTGTGPTSWYHDGTIFGVADMRGNAYEWLAGVYLDNGKIIIMPNNDAADPSLVKADFANASTKFKAIKSDGTLVAQSETLDVMYYDYTDKTYKTAEIATSLENQQTIGDPYSSQAFKTLAARQGVSIPNIMRVLNLAPGLTQKDKGNFYMRNLDVRAPRAGGDGNYSSSAGLRYMNWYRYPAGASWSCSSRGGQLL